MEFVRSLSLSLSLSTGLSPHHVLGPEAERKNRQKKEGVGQAGVVGDRHLPPSSPGDWEEGKG